jgi:O-antigen/teichoic acid export membrane protein
MNLKLRGFAKDALIYGLGDFGGKVAALILVPIISRILTPAEYGVLDLLNVSATFVTAVIGMNLLSGLQKYYYLTDGEQRRILVTSTVVFLLAVTSCTAALLMLLSRSISSLAFGSTKYHRLILLYSATLPVSALLDAMLLLLRLDRRPIVYSAYSIASATVLPITTYLCVATLGMRMNGVVAAMLFTSTALSLALALHHRRQFTRRIEFGRVLDLARFSLPGVPGIIAGNIQNMLPRYFLGFYGGLTAVGIYALADKVAKIVDMLKAAFNRAWNPFAYSNAGKDDERYLYEKVFKFFGFGVLLVCLLFGVFSKQVLWILTPPQYHGAEVFVAGLCLFYGARFLVLILGTGLYTSNKVLHTSYLEGVLLIACAVSAALLVPPWGTGGMVVAMDLSAILYLLYYAAITKKHFPFEFSAYRLIAALVLAIGLWVVSRIPSTGNVIGARAIGINLAIAVFYAVMGSVIILSASEKSRIRASAAGVWRKVTRQNLERGSNGE